MRPSRRGLLVGAWVSVAAAGCIQNPGPDCPGATVRLSLTPIESAEDPMELGSGTLAPDAETVVETAIEGEHVENCVSWAPREGETGPSEGLRAVGERLEAHTGVDLADRTGVTTAEAVRGGEFYRVELRVER